MLYFECPSCKANCETTAAFAGKAVFCPHCGKSVTVPTDPAAVTTTPPAPKPKPVPASTGITTPEVAAAQARQNTATPSIAQDPSGNQIRNVVLVLVGVAVLVGVGIWLASDPNGSKTGGGPNPVVVMETSMGTIKVELYQDKSPITTENFLKYVDTKHYDGTIFHRVISDFMIQGGGFEPGLREKRSKFPQIKNEAGNGLSNERGTIAMARTNDPDSATDQFFINVANNAARGLDRSAKGAGYAVFGKVIDGMDVVDKIRAVEVRDIPNSHENVPVKDVVIKSVRRVQPTD
jgi:cyclophilin family peptidyl-prolyl cis-trans isomerase